MKTSKTMNNYIQFAIIGLGIIAIYYRTVQDNDYALLTYMSIVNSIAMFLSCMLLFGEVDYRMVQFHKKDLEQYNGNHKRNWTIGLFRFIWAISSLLLVVLLAIILFRLKSDLINDLITIGTLTLALTTEMLSKLIAVLFYSYK